MFKISLEKQAQKFVAKLPPKQARQVKNKVLSLRQDQFPPDSIQLKGFLYRRVDIGEYRIIYIVREDTIFVPLIGKRNDGDVYKKLERK